MNRDQLLRQPDYRPTLPDMFRHAVEAHGERVLMVTGDRRLTFAEADRRSAILARRLLAAGVGKGARIGLLAPNTPDWLIAFLAITRVGAVAVLLSTLYQRRELGWALRHGDLQALMMADRFLNHDYVRRMEEIAPDLAAQSRERPLVLEAAPYLRAVYVWGEVIPDWAIDGARAAQDAPAEVSDAVLAAVEQAITPADLALQVYTSGTTADPKGVVHAHGPVVRRSYALRIAKRHGDDARILVLGPFCWIAGLLNLLIAIHKGLRIVTPISPRLEDVAAAAALEEVTDLSAQPAQVKQLRDHMSAHDLKVGTALRDAFDGPRDEDGRLIDPARLSRGLGMTETMGMHSLEAGSVMPPDKPGGFGRGVPDIERQIRDLDTGEPLAVGEWGELFLRGPGMFVGMYKKERHEVFDSDGFYATGDVCRIDEDGYLFFRGRRGEMIKTTGANVSPREVELALEAYPDVQEAGVFGMPGEGYDEIVTAVVSPKGDARLDPEELRARLRRDISSFKTPRTIHVAPMDLLPHTGSGKLNKRAVKDALLRGEPLVPGG